MVPHRKHQNLSLLLQDFSFNQIGGTATEKIQLNKDDANMPQKRKLKLFQHILEKQADEEPDTQVPGEEQNGTEKSVGANKVAQAKKYDVKQIKEEIWKILEAVIP